MSDLPTRLIRTVNGRMTRTEIGPDVDVIAAMAALGYAFTGPTRHRGIRAELENAPTFSGLRGPMWDGDGIRYEVIQNSP